MLRAERIAVVVGIGEIVDRSRDLAQATEPTALIAAALRTAATDAGDGWLERLDAVDLVALTSWRYKDPVRDICARVGIAPAHAANTRRGGETPVRLLHEAALKVTRGECKACAIVGGEATNARVRARKSGFQLPWTPMPELDESAQFSGLSTVRSALAERYDMLEPSRIYPLYETASQAAWGQTAAEANRESARLWARYAEVARAYPFAWNSTAPNSQTIGTVSAENRLINWPYLKLMVANPYVNQAAAFIVTTLAEAREAGITEDRMTYVLGGAAANEPDDFLHRDRYDHSAAQDAVLRAVIQCAGGAKALSFMELYSCFPIVPKLALRCLGLDPETVIPSVTGGLTFFGGPLHNFMSHAICAMVRALRRSSAATGLLYGQGGYVTKHHALLLGTEAPHHALPEDPSVQRAADALRGPSPPVRDDYAGPATLEAFTVQYARDSQPLQGIVVLRTPMGERTMARVPADDSETLALLQSWDRNPVGLTGIVTPAPDGRANWTPLSGATLGLRSSAS
jgi:acetyl-CoA C-acetyltransferase